MFHSQSFLILLKNKELDELYVSTAVRGLAISMVAVFVPIYLLELKYSLASIMIFYALFYAFKTLFIYPAAKIVSKYGPKHAILYSLPFLILNYLMLRTLDVYFWPLWVIAIIGGINSSLFWMGYHTDFAKFSNKKSRGKEIGLVTVLSSLLYSFGPAIGGVIAAAFGFHALFILIAVILGLSAIPLFMTKDIHEPFNFSLKKSLSGQKLKEFWGLAGIGIEGSVGAVIWPIFIFLFILKSVTSLGIVTSLSLVLSLIFTLIIAELTDVRRKFVFKASGVLNAALWLVKIFLKTVPQVYIADSFYGIFKTMKKISFDATSYDKARRGNLLGFIVFREIVPSLGRVAVFLIMAVTSSYILSFALGALGSLIYILF